MAPSLLLDISDVDFDRVQFDAEAIETINPHRGCMRLLDAIVQSDDRYTEVVAYRDVKDDEFWVPGHIPGRPIFPGVLMIEAAAQLASWACLKKSPDVPFMGFAGVDDVKFRGMVKPGDRFVLLLKELECRRRRSVCLTQGLVNGTLVYEGKITGMPM